MGQGAPGWPLELLWPLAAGAGQRGAQSLAAGCGSRRWHRPTLIEGPLGTVGREGLQSWASDWEIQGLSLWGLGEGSRAMDWASGVLQGRAWSLG